MSSSESEDDCYGNTAARLQKLKNHYQEDLIDSTNLLNDSQTLEIDEILKKNAPVPAKTGKRSRKKADNVPTTSTSAPVNENAMSETTARKRRATRSKANPDTSLTLTVEDTPPPTPPVPKRGRRGAAATVNNTRGRRRGRQSIQSTLDSIFQDILSPSPPRGRGRGRRSGGRGRRGCFSSMSSSIPIFSVGNTYDYPDESENQQLFSAPKNADKDDVLVIEDENDEIEENEELSVKVFWQSSDIFKFSIRKFQKLAQIFDYFAKKENVSHDNLLFTYNDKILRVDNTPESINYNIGKFIDGGIVNKSVSSLTAVTKTNDCKTVKNGMKIKFQSQNVKKPFETTVGLDDRLSVAMMKCAEHLEIPLDRLKFVFDGDTLSSKSTARELEFEGGECIDVKILS